MGVETEANNPFLLGDKMYNFVKKLVQVIIPAGGALYFALSKIWGFPHGEDVVGSLMAVATFLGVVLGISSAQYTASGAGYQGHMTVQPNSDGVTKVTGLHFDGEPKDLEGKSAMTFKIHHLAPAKVEEQLEEDLEEDHGPPEPPHKAPAKRTRAPSKKK
jgi:hypothetical protein